MFAKGWKRYSSRKAEKICTGLRKTLQFSTMSTIISKKLRSVSKRESGSERQYPKIRNYRRLRSNCESPSFTDDTNSRLTV